MITRYSATLDAAQLEKFLRDFYFVGSGRSARLTITPNKDNNSIFEVQFQAINKYNEQFVNASMTEGMLHHDGWDKIFAAETITEEIHPW